MVVLRMFELLAEVHERPGDLDERFEKLVVGAGGFKPEVFQHVVSFVVIAAVKAFKKTEEAWVTSAAFSDAEGVDKDCDAVGFFR